MRLNESSIMVPPAGSGGGGGAVDSVNGQTGVVVLSADDVGAIGLSDDNALTGQNTTALLIEGAWTAMTTGTGKTPSLNTQYYVAAFTANTTVDSYVGTPANGSRVIYLLIGCNGTATFTFPAAQRLGDATGTSTTTTPTAGVHKLVFEYTNGAWYYSDTIVTLITSTQVPYGTATGGLTSEAAFAYNASTNVLTVGAVSLGAGGETSVMGPQQTSDGQPLHYTMTVVAAGTAYTATDAYASVTFGTTSPILTFDSAGLYLIGGAVQVSYSGASYAAAQSITGKIRRTNDTAADVSGTTFGQPIPVMTTYTGLGPTINFPLVPYTPTATTNTLTFQVILSALPSVGSVTISAASITFIRVY